MSRKTKDFVPKIVAVEMLEKNGVDVERLKGLIRRGVGSEFSTYYHYTILRMHSTGLEGEGIKEIVEDARIEVILNRWFPDYTNWVVLYRKMLVS